MHSSLGRHLAQAYTEATLKTSSLFPAHFRPAADMRNGPIAAVIANEKPVILCGHLDDRDAVRRASALAVCPDLRRLLSAMRIHGEIVWGTVIQGQVDWTSEMTGIFSKPSGTFDLGSADAPLMCVVLNDPRMAFATNLCIHSDAAKAIDPNAPHLGNPGIIRELAKL